MDIETNQPKPIPASQAVAWWPVLLYVADVLRVEPTEVPYAAQRVPLLGTPAWCALADDAPSKLAAVLHGGCHHALRLEMTQEACADASKDISAAADWRAVASELSGLAAFRKANPWSRRVAS